MNQNNLLVNRQLLHDPLSILKIFFIVFLITVLHVVSQFMFFICCIQYVVVVLTLVLFG